MAFNKYKGLPKCCLKWGAMTKYRKTKPVKHPLTDEEKQHEDAVIQELMRRITTGK